MILIDKTSFKQYLKEAIEHYPLEVNGILVGSNDRFLIKGISYLTQKEVDAIYKEYEPVPEDFVNIMKVGREIPIKSTEENVKRLLKNGEVIKGVLHIHTIHEYPTRILAPFYRLYRFFKKPKLKKPELSSVDIKRFDEIIKSHSKPPVYYGILNIPYPPSGGVILKELSERLLFFENGEVLTNYIIKE